MWNEIILLCAFILDVLSSSNAWNKLFSKAMIILLDYILNPIDEDLPILVLLLKTKPAVSKKKTDSAI